MSEIEIQLNGLEVAVVEDEPMGLEGLIQILQKLGCNVVWTAKNYEDAEEKAQSYLPNVVFVDLKLLRGTNDYETGWQLVKALRGRDSRISVIICSSTPVVDNIVLEAIHLGCPYIVKQDLWQQEQTVVASALLAAHSKSVTLSNEVAGAIQGIVSKIRGKGGLSLRARGS